MYHQIRHSCAQGKRRLPAARISHGAKVVQNGARYYALRAKNTMSDTSSTTASSPASAPAEPVVVPASSPASVPARERPAPDPTRYGDWEKNGRCIDF
jgi:hypothetical protein